MMSDSCEATSNRDPNQVHQNPQDVDKQSKDPAKKDKNREDDDGKPKRPLSAYNMFFRDERVKLLANRPVRPEGVPRRGHGKMGFAEMARTISAKWNTLDAPTKSHYQRLGRREKALYRKRLAEWKLTSNEQNPDKDDKKPERVQNQPNSSSVSTASVPVNVNENSAYQQQLHLNYSQKNGYQQMAYERSSKPQQQRREQHHYHANLANYHQPNQYQSLFNNGGGYVPAVGSSGSHLLAEVNVTNRMLEEQARLVGEISSMISDMTQTETATTGMVAPSTVRSAAVGTAPSVWSAPAGQSHFFAPNHYPQQFQQSIFHPTAMPCSSYYHDGVDIDCISSSESESDQKPASNQLPSLSCIDPLMPLEAQGVGGGGSNQNDFPVDNLQNIMLNGADCRPGDFSNLFEN